MRLERDAPLKSMETTDKIWRDVQAKLLVLSKTLLSLLSPFNRNVNEISVDASRKVMKLWCTIFRHGTHQWRRNVMQLTDSDFIEILDDSQNFNEEEFESYNTLFLNKIQK